MIANAFGVPQSTTGDIYSDITPFKIIQAVCTSCFILGPLSLGRNMSSFRNLAILSLSSLILTIIVSKLRFFEVFYFLFIFGLDGYGRTAILPALLRTVVWQLSRGQHIMLFCKHTYWCRCCSVCVYKPVQYFASVFWASKPSQRQTNESDHSLNHYRDYAVYVYGPWRILLDTKQHSWNCVDKISVPLNMDLRLGWRNSQHPCAICHGVQYNAELHALQKRSVLYGDWQRRLLYNLQYYLHSHVLGSHVLCLNCVSKCAECAGYLWWYCVRQHCIHHST